MIRALIACITLTLPTAALAEVDIQGVESPGGLTAWLVEEPSIPFTAININFLGGGLVDPEGKRGAVNLMTGLLEEGAGDLDAQAFARAREALAARYTFRAYTDSLTISAQMLTENRDEAVELLRLALMEPRFDQPALDRVRGQVEAGIRGDSQDPDEISGDAFLAAAFGDHPYGTDMDGTLESVAALTRQDMIDAHRAALVQDRMVIGIVGDITAEEAGLMIDRLLGDLPTGGP
ncbi:MAG: M16 family metallopeptidase, partial [Shimia sp.]